MKTFSDIEFSRTTLKLLTVLTAGILVSPLVLFIMRKQVAESSLPASMSFVDLPSNGGVRPSNTSVEKICFQRGSWIYLADLVTGKETKLVEGIGSGLAPTGESLAFLSVEENEGITNQILPPTGRLELLNLRTNVVAGFNTLRDSRAVQPIWSNEGTRLAVTLANDESERTGIAVLDPRTAEWRKLTAHGDVGTDGMYADSWAPDDQSILFHSLRSLYEVRLDGSPVQKIPVDELFENGAISSASRFSFSSDRRYLLFDSIIDAPDEPATSIISIFDLTTRTLRRILPKTVQGRYPWWLPSKKELLFTRIEWDQDQLRWRHNVSKIDLNGAGLTTLVTDADLVSYSTR